MLAITVPRKIFLGCISKFTQEMMNHHQMDKGKEETHC